MHFYSCILGLEKRNDITFSPGRRLLTVAFQGQSRPELALAVPDVSFYGEAYLRSLREQRSHTLSSVFVTHDCAETYAHLLDCGVTFLSSPTRHLYGMEALFLDPDGNAFSLLETTTGARSLFKNIFMGTAA
ncbi:hypothetical protein KDI_18250 [Dictyobacter arantiisoli]|uniref:VOC domain-containing protein n=1 Tax=Dictyobacter arantiisoli TaxID=2014874 RepID=A0A5A5T9S7_9CHLR|nr:hypothetical protein KDI_18250 [Dictyobacter arantiisoli]